MRKNILQLLIAVMLLFGAFLVFTSCEKEDYADCKWVCDKKEIAPNGEVLCAVNKLVCN